MSKKDWVVGVDEVGRGPLAGPVYIGVYAYRKGSSTNFLKGVKDSKLLSKGSRDEWNETLKNRNDVRYAVTSTSAKKIDEKGVVWSIQNAIQRALKKLELETNNCFVYLDGGLRAPDIYTRQKTVIKGDQLIPVISAASILAKVTRDKYMSRLSGKYPQYGFGKNKGYGTQFHRDMIQKHGTCAVHRESYCKNIISKKCKK